MEANQEEIANLIQQLQPTAKEARFPGRRLRVAILLRAFEDVRQGGRHAWEARRWLLLEKHPSQLNSRALMEEIGLDVDAIRRTLRERLPLQACAA